jgi:hypothetical protein
MGTAAACLLRTTRDTLRHKLNSLRADCEFAGVSLISDHR